jgi:hypothetical protein
MSTTRGLTRWLHLPAAGGANDRLRADQPLSSGTMQILASNAYLGCYENELRTLWECPGEADIAGTLGYGTSAGSGTTDPYAFDWDADPFSSSTVRSWFCGLHRIRTMPDGRWPTIVLAALAMNGGASTTGIILVGRPAMGRPQPGDLWGTGSTTSGTLASVSASLTITEGHVGSRIVAPIDEAAAAGTSPAEMGRETVMAFYAGVYTDGAGKATVRRLSLYMTPP